jgi:hypothetical protein
MSTALYQYLYLKEEDGGLPSWAAIAGDDAYGKGTAGGRILTTYSGRNLDARKDSFKFYISPPRITMEKTFGILVSRWGIVWSPPGCSLGRATRIIIACATLHIFLIYERCTGTGDIADLEFDMPGPDEDSSVEGEPQVHLQDYLHTDSEVARHVHPGSSTISDNLARQLHVLGLQRPACRGKVNTSLCVSDVITDAVQRQLLKHAPLRN